MIRRFSAVTVRTRAAAVRFLSSKLTQGRGRSGTSVVSPARAPVLRGVTTQPESLASTAPNEWRKTPLHLCDEGAVPIAVLVSWCSIPVYR